MEGKILVVDDEPDLTELISYNLRRDGFTVSTVHDGEEALEQVRRESFDLIILDLMLPGMHGIDVCRMIRNSPRTERLPVIMLTARGDTADKVRGLNIGADDYMTKPFDLKELIARVRSLLRRTRESTEGRAFKIGELEIDRKKAIVLKRGNPVRLSTTEFRLLLFLAERKGRVFSRDQLLEAIWKDDTDVVPRTVDVHIRRLRTIIEDDAANPTLVKTRRGAGYYME